MIYSWLLTSFTTGWNPSIILILLDVFKIGLTKWNSSDTTDKLASASISAIVCAVCLSLKIFSLIIFLISVNKSYSRVIIFSSAFKINSSFSFNSGVINLSALVKVCLLSHPNDGSILSICPLVSSI